MNEEMTRPLTLIFDLDGTLIDSSKSILAGFVGAFEREGILPAVPPSPDIIGPPLKETLALLAGNTDPALVDRLAEGFKLYYDTEGYKATTVFDGIHNTLAELSRCNRSMHIATNKRLNPTLKIIEHLGWEKHFGKIRALDAWSPPVRNKSEMIGRLLAEENISPNTAIYIGDREEDYVAARANGLPFALATWGYGGAPEIENSLKLTVPSELLSL